ncbi:MAG: glucose-6-phosphate isomerase [Thiotrichales bacterium SG8_50]|nr:MAG: glucose-6-phosphate isomerase [Thiotrichales bacterium SG8_50]
MMDQEIWKALESHQAEIAQVRLEKLFDDDPQRFKKFSLEAAGLMLDYSKNLVTGETLDLLVQLAQSCGLADRIEDLLAGKKVNNTEDRPALHTALRGDGEGLNAATREEVGQTFKRMGDFVDQLHGGRWLGAGGKPITDVVNIGIGGSDLGPVMASTALTPYDKKKIGVHFVSNIDPEHLSERLELLNPYTTLFIVSSKSFSTIETRMNAESAREWCKANGIKQEDIARHFVAVSTNIKAATDFGIAEENIFPMWDWVGGRYSLWSAIGLPIAIKVGMDNFNAIRQGGHLMDQHFRSAPFRQNMPVLLGLLSAWYINFFKTDTQIIIPYDYNLRKFPSYLQQLEMESNGKRVTRDGEPVALMTKGAIFGEAGSNTQHSFHQLLHQGTHCFPIDFIAPVNSHHPIGTQHDYLFANCLSQTRALMKGRSLEDVQEEMRSQGKSEEEIANLAPHRVVPGNKPTNTLTMDKLTPETLGALIALYEHKVYTESVVWDINAFDQWGVELGKVLSEEVYAAMTHEVPTDMDGSTAGLVEYYNKHQN